MAAKKPATKSADAQAAKPKSRAARKPAAPKKPAKHPVTAASQPTPVELQSLAQMCPCHVEFVWQCLVRLNATKDYQAAFEALLPAPQDRMEHRR